MCREGYIGPGMVTEVKERANDLEMKWIPPSVRDKPMEGCQDGKLRRNIDLLDCSQTDLHKGVYQCF
jgi:hypothetical protein